MINFNTYQTKLNTLIASMKEFWDEDLGYPKKYIDKLEKLITEYLTALDEMKQPSDKEIMKQVKKLVLALNKLNEQTDYGLIETEEREGIWEIVQNSAVECGLTNLSEDITEEWRDW